MGFWEKKGRRNLEKDAMHRSRVGVYAELASVLEDFGSWKRLEHFVKGFLKAKERVVDISGSRIPIVEC